MYNFLFLPAVIALIFIPSVELVIPLGTKTNEGNAETKTQPVTVEKKQFFYLILIFACFFVLFTH